MYNIIYTMHTHDISFFPMDFGARPQATRYRNTVYVWPEVTEKETKENSTKK